MNKIKFKYAPGQRVKDKMTGLQGIISASIINIDKCHQSSVQPFSPDAKTMLDSWIIDNEQLMTLRGGDLSGVNELDNIKIFEVEFKFTPGDVVKDKTLGVKGTITKALYYLNRCIHYYIIPKSKDSVKIAEVVVCREQSLELIKPVKVKKEEEKPLGGPSIKSIRL